jgi:hypothetical protein
MKLSLKHPSSLSTYDHHTINDIAASGFGYDNSADMLDDTLTHIQSADFVQQAKIGQETVGFALYKRCLWR